jgi:hypothetical protein
MLIAAVCLGGSAYAQQADSVKEVTYQKTGTSLIPQPVDIMVSALKRHIPSSNQKTLKVHAFWLQ